MDDDNEILKLIHTGTVRKLCEALTWRYLANHVLFADVYFSPGMVIKLSNDSLHAFMHFLKHKYNEFDCSAKTPKLRPKKVSKLDGEPKSVAEEELLMAKVR